MAKKIDSTEEAWDERILGASEEHVAVAGEEHESALNDALGLQLISIRLPKQMIEQYKLIAHFHGVGYQPLMRDVMSRFVPGALRELLEAEKEKAEKAEKARTEIPPLRKAA
jgi:predicted DNA binding CopG/RHH family protein